MLQRGKTMKLCHGIRTYSFCCPPKRPPCGCPGGGQEPRKFPPADCKPGPIPPNPCVPRFHHGKDTWKRYRALAMLVGVPLIIIQALRSLGHEPPPKGPCREYEYMNIRTKRFPWGNGVESFFHNEHVNHLPGDCEPPPLDCD